MYFTVWGRLFVVLVVLTIGQVDGICESDFVQLSLGFKGGEVIIDPNCDFASIIIKTSTPSSIYQSFGIFAEGDRCQVFDGTNDTGTLLGTFTGDGSAIGGVRSSSPNLFLVCTNTGPSPPPSILRFNYQTSDEVCEETYTESYTRINRNGLLNTGTFCVWTFEAYVGCVFQFNLNMTLPTGDFLFINWPEDALDKTGNATRIGDLYDGPTTPVSWNLGGDKVQLMYLSDSNEGGLDDFFHVDVERTCPPPPPPTIECGETTVITLDEENLNKLNASELDILYIAPSEDVKPEDVDPSCVTNIQNPYFVFNITQCVPVASESDGLIKLTYIVWNQKRLDLSAPVQRYTIYCLNLTCVFDANVTVSSSEINPEIMKIGFNTDPAEGEFQVSLDLYSDDSLEDPLSDGDTVLVSDYVFAKVELSDLPDSADNFQVDMTSCWSTEGMEPTSTPIYPIITASCPASNPYDPANAIVVMRNSHPIYGQFKFRSFVWTNVTEQELYVHCDVTICDTDAGLCPDECDKKRRRRREITIAGNKQLLSAGPIIISSQHTNSELQKENDGKGVQYVDVEEMLRSIQDSHDQEMYAFLGVVLVVLICGVVYRFALY